VKTFFSHPDKQIFQHFNTKKCINEKTSDAQKIKIGIFYACKTEPKALYKHPTQSLEQLSTYTNYFRQTG